MTPPVRAASVDALLAEASRVANLDDFGDGSHRDGLNAFMAAWQDAPCTQQAPMRQQALNILVKRLQAVEQMKRHTSALDSPITAPLFILGLPRTGTTALHHLLAQDPQFQELEYWVGTNPMPRPALDTWADRPEFRKAVDEIEGLYRAIPELRKIHHMSANEPEECRLLMEHTFASTALGWTWDIPDYNRWLESADLTEQYQYYANALRLIGANDTDKRWLLKCPHHLLSLEALLKTFPDARILFLHRNPTEVIPSNCSLAASLQQWSAEDVEKRHALGRRLLGGMDTALRLALTARDRHPCNFMNVSFARFRQDPLAMVRDIYARFELPLSETTVKSMAAWLEVDAAKSKGHRYTLAEFGLSTDEVCERFSYYNEF